MSIRQPITLNRIATCAISIATGLIGLNGLTAQETAHREATILDVRHEAKPHPLIPGGSAQDPIYQSHSCKMYYHDSTGLGSANVRCQWDNPEIDKLRMASEAKDKGGPMRCDFTTTHSPIIDPTVTGAVSCYPLEESPHREAQNNKSPKK